MTKIDNRGYAVPDVLVSTEWVAENLERPDLRIVESNSDPLVYPLGHISGAVEVDWARDLNDQIRRDNVSSQAFASMAERIGITPETTVVFYGDSHNWWATYAYWVFQLFGHSRAKVMDGGRLKWEREGRLLTGVEPEIAATRYPTPQRRDSSMRAFRDEVLAHAEAGLPLVDTRTPLEFNGTRRHMLEYPDEGALRGGHIPGAMSVPAKVSINEDGTFKAADKLRAVYVEEHGLRPQEKVITYCRIGERASHTWFVLSCLLGFSDVRNYDGSWTEWGNLVGVPIER